MPKKEGGRLGLRFYLRLFKTIAAATITITATAATIAMYSVMDGSASVLGGGATEGEGETEGES